MFDSSSSPMVLTLLADPARAPLDDSTVALARRALAEAGAAPGPADRLAAAACDIPFACSGGAAAAVRAALAGRPVDAAVQPAAGRRKAVLVADMESTVIANEMLDELADLVGLRRRIAAITARAMNGEIGFAEALAERVALLAGLPAAQLDAAAGRIVLNPGAEVLVRTMRAHGAHTALVSGGFDCFVEPVRARLGFDAAVCNRLEIADGRLTGRVVPPILGRDGKLQALEAAARARGVGPAAVLAVGDGANDLPMLLAAGTGVAWRAKPAVAAAAPLRVDHADLAALLYLQGYREEELAR